MNVGTKDNQVASVPVVARVELPLSGSASLVGRYDEDGTAVVYWISPLSSLRRCRLSRRSSVRLAGVTLLFVVSVIDVWPSSREVP